MKRKQREKLIGDCDEGVVRFSKWKNGKEKETKRKLKYLWTFGSGDDKRNQSTYSLCIDLKKKGKSEESVWVDLKRKKAIAFLFDFADLIAIMSWPELEKNNSINNKRWKRKYKKFLKLTDKLISHLNS